MLDTKDTLIELVQGLEDGLLVSPYVVLEPPRDPSSDVVSDGGACWDSKDLRNRSAKARHFFEWNTHIIKFFKCTLFGFGHKQEDHDKGRHIHRAMSRVSLRLISEIDISRIKSKGTLWSERSQ